MFTLRTLPDAAECMMQGVGRRVEAERGRAERLQDDKRRKVPSAVGLPHGLLQLASGLEIGRGRANFRRGHMALVPLGLTRAGRT